MYAINGNLIVFRYDRDELFESCALRSAYLSRSLADKDGRYAGEDMAMTEDERDAFDESLKKCLPGLWAVVGKMCPEGADALSAEDEIVFRVTRGNASVRDAVVADGRFREVIVAGVLREWFALCGDLKSSEVCRAEAETGSRELWDALFRMRGRENRG